MKRIAKVLAKEDKRPLKNLTSLDEAIAEFGPSLAKIPFWPDPSPSPAGTRTFAELLNSRNTGLTNLIRYHLCLHVGYLGSWKDPELNVSPESMGDHVPDMTLPLYAREGDIIVTEDKKFRRFFAMAESTGRIRAMAWSECLKHVL